MIEHFPLFLSTDDAPLRRAEDEDRRRSQAERHEEQGPDSIKYLASVLGYK